MNYHLFLCIFFVGLFFSSTAQQHTDILPDLTGNELLTQLKIEYKSNTILPYDQSRDVMFSQVDRAGDSLECIYSGYKIFLPFGQDPTSAAYERGINTEHSYPQGLWDGGNSPKSDMHHLFPTREEVNTDRGNNPFADIDDNLTDTWYYMDMEMSSIPTANIDLYAESTSTKFEPRESAKGNIARAIFYFYTMYRNEANAESTTFFQDQATTLCEWHDNDPVDAKELERTWKISDHQGKVNPFVLDCTLAYRTNYCSGELSTYCATISPVEDLDISKTVTISPNPARQHVKINFSEGISAGESIDIQFFDVSGKLLGKETLKDGNDLLVDLNEYPKGVILIKIQTQKGVTAQRIIHH